jgi:trehalose-phosphatase
VPEDPAAGILQLIAGRSPACFLDYDGTLTPIAARPEDARLTVEMRATLARAARHFPLAVISGRDLEDLRRLVGLPHLIYAGSHGFEIAGPGLCFEAPGGTDALRPLAEASDELAGQVEGVPGARLERKRFAVAVHLRQAPAEALAGVEAAVDQVLTRHPQLRKTGGKQVFELRPAIDWDKGRAVHWLIGRLGLDRSDVVPVYVGDDDTDEDAFRTLRGQGLGILVAETLRPTLATARLINPDQLRRLLWLLGDQAEGGTLPS